MSVAVSFVDNSPKILELINEKLRVGVGAAAERLADGYKAGLQKTTAPPHSPLGAIPHAYMGHKPFGYGPVNGVDYSRNNTTAQGFARDQTEYLSTYIHGTASAPGQRVQGLVGFIDSHVARRDMNYLLWHDRNGRPWVKELYKDMRPQMISDFIDAARKASR